MSGDVERARFPEGSLVASAEGMLVRYLSLALLVLPAFACGSAGAPPRDVSQEPNAVPTQAGADPVTNAPPGAQMSPESEPPPPSGMPSPPSGTPTPPPPGPASGAGAK